MGHSYQTKKAQAGLLFLGKLICISQQGDALKSGGSQATLVGGSPKPLLHWQVVCGQKLCGRQLTLIYPAEQSLS